MDAARKKLSPFFQRLYSRIGRPSDPAGKAVRASVLQMLYAIRCDRPLMEQLNFKILYHWFVGLGMGMDEKVRDPTVHMKKRARLGEDKGYDTTDLVDPLRDIRVTPHVAQDTTNRSSMIDARTTRHAGYEVSQRMGKRVEETFGWMKTVGILRKVEFRGQLLVDSLFRFGPAVYDLVRITVNGRLVAAS